MGQLATQLVTEVPRYPQWSVADPEHTNSSLFDFAAELPGLPVPERVVDDVVRGKTKVPSARVSEDGDLELVS